MNISARRLFFNRAYRKVNSAFARRNVRILILSRRVALSIRRYLPVLKNFPTRYIHEPWNAPLSIQHAAKCIIGKEYSLPMVNHSKSVRINIERMKQAYKQLNKYRGNGKCKLIFARGGGVFISGTLSLLSKRRRYTPRRYEAQFRGFAHALFEFFASVCLRHPGNKLLNESCDIFFSVARDDRLVFRTR